jgi:outer membrane protein assembly factor BamD (BamD/ComL family)
MDRGEAEAGASGLAEGEVGATECGPGAGWRGGGLQEIEPTQRVVTKRIRGRRKGVSGPNDPYEVLGVRRGASAREIRAAYLHLVKQHHPDRHGPAPDSPDDDGEQLKSINEAYRKLRGAGRGEARRKAVRFVVGALASALPLLAIIGAYLGGWIGPRPSGPDVATAPERPRQTAAPTHVPAKGGADSTSVLQKDSTVGRQIAFDEAKRQATKAAWTKFIADFPGGEPEAYARQALGAIAQVEIAEARKREERLAWAVAETGTKADLQQFLARYTDGEYAGKAKAAIADIVRTEQAAWLAAERAGTREALQRFLDSHPDAAEAPRAGKALAAIAAAEERARLELASWSKAEADGSKAALSRYLAAFPSGLHAAEARTRVAGLEAEERDEEAWRIALKANRKADFASYLKTHPTGRRARDAQMRIAEIDLAETLFAVKEVVREVKQAAKEARMEPVRAPSVARPQPRPPAAAAEDAMPFVGADGRIRR